VVGEHVAQLMRRGRRGKSEERRRERKEEEEEVVVVEEGRKGYPEERHVHGHSHLLFFYPHLLFTPLYSHLEERHVRRVRARQRADEATARRRTHGEDRG